MYTQKYKQTLMRRSGNSETRPDTWPIPVADGQAGAEIRVFALSQLDDLYGPTDQPTDRRMDKASYRVASPRLKREKELKTGEKKKRKMKEFKKQVVFGFKELA